MRQRFAVGAELDLLAPAELTAATAKIIRAVVGLNQAPTIQRVTQVFFTDGAGNLGGGANGPGVEVYQVPTGRRVDVQRLGLSSPAYTPATPLAAGWVIGCADSGTSPPDFTFPLPGTTTVLPFNYSQGDGALRLGGGQRLILVGAGLPVTTEITVRAQVRLWYDPTPNLADQIP
jgi:hypothetical protein